MKNLQAQKIPIKHMVKHETKQHVLIKFIIILVIILAYFLLVSLKYGIQDGFMVTALTWSFFVLCTPVADAGFFLDFPIRLLTKLKMVVSEILVWIIAIALNIFTFFLNPELYSKTKLLELFKHILESPFPFWGIILVSMVGTFVSIQFGDELLDKIKHEDRKMYHKHKYNYRLFAMAGIVLLTIVLYDFLLKKLGVNLPI